MAKLESHVAIVTGASRGIGAEIARLFAAEGAKVVCAARTLNEGDHRLLEGSLSGTVAAIEQAGGEALAVAADVSDEAACRTLVQAAIDAYGPDGVRYGSDGGIHSSRHQPASTVPAARSRSRALP